MPIVFPFLMPITSSRQDFDSNVCRERPDEVFGNDKLVNGPKTGYTS
jgi:hypothetical protein